MALVVSMRVPAAVGTIEGAAEGLTGLNFQIMTFAREHGGGLPLLYESGIVYRREAKGREAWQAASELLKSGEGDCEDLAAYRAAELRMEGEPARVVVRKTKRGSYHAIVQRGDGTFEDPSRILLYLEGTDPNYLR